MACDLPKEREKQIVWLDMENKNKIFYSFRQLTNPKPRLVGGGKKKQKISTNGKKHIFLWRRSTDSTVTPPLPHLRRAGARNALNNLANKPGKPDARVRWTHLQITTAQIIIIIIMAHRKRYIDVQATFVVYIFRGTRSMITRKIPNKLLMLLTFSIV